MMPPTRRPMNKTTAAIGLFFIAVVACLLAAGAEGTDRAEHTRLAIQRFIQDSAGPYWYTVSIQGQPAGYVRWQAFADSTHDDGAFRVEECAKITFVVDGRAQQMDSRQVTQYDEALLPRRIEMWQNQMGRVTDRTVEVGPDKLHVTLRQPDGIHESDIARPDDFGSDIRVFLAAAAGQIKPGWEMVFSAFDPYVGHLDRYSIRVAEQRQTDLGIETLLSTRLEKMGVEVRTWLGPDGIILRQAFPQLMDLELVRTTEQIALADIPGPTFSSGIRVGTPPADPHRADRVCLIATAVTDNIKDMIPATDRQQVLLRGDGSAEIIVASEREPAHLAQLPISAETPGAPADLAAYLQPNEITQSDSEEISSLAADIIGNETDAWTAAKLLLDWVHDNLKSVKSDPRPVSALEVLEQGSGDCSEHAVLLAALAKAVGIPPRIIIGLVYVNGAYGYHEWNELYVGEWVEMDPSWNRYTVGAGHLKLAGAPADREAMLSNHLAGGRTIGTLFLKFKPQ
jgi:transglutaminase-like putative cysteine protease